MHRMAVAALASTVLAIAPTAARAAADPSVAARPCPDAQVLAWVGLGGRPGSASGVAVPLEFSNIGSTACSVFGYQDAVAVGPAGHPAAQRAGHQPGTRPRRFTLRPGQTAHAVLTIAVASAACRAPVTAAGLRITPPGARAAQRIGLVFSVCPRHRTLLVGPVRPGTGIP